jgi:membrane protein
MSETRRADQWRGRADSALAWADASFVGRLWRRLLEMEFIERSIALAAKAFVSLLPVVIVIAAFLPDRLRAGVVEALATRLGLSGASLDYVQEAFSTPDQIRAATSVIGLVLTLLFAVSFATAVQRVYLRAWRRPAQRALQDKRRGVVWLAGAVAFLATVGSVGRLLVGLPGTFATLVVGIAGSSALWWWSALTFLRGHVRWRPLLPTALLTGIGASLYAAAASVWMPSVLEGNVRQFGFVGVGMSLVTWFVGFGFLIVGAAAAGPALADGDGRVARWLRHDGLLTPGAPEALPGPETPPSLLDYLRRDRADTDL